MIFINQEDVNTVIKLLSICPTLPNVIYLYLPYDFSN